MADPKDDWLVDRFNRLEDRQEKMSNKLDDLRLEIKQETSATRFEAAEIKVDLRDHMRRTAIAEENLELQRKNHLELRQELRPVQEFHKFQQGLYKLAAKAAGFGTAVVGFAAAILKLLGKI